MAPTTAAAGILTTQSGTQAEKVFGISQYGTKGATATCTLNEHEKDMKDR